MGSSYFCSMITILTIKTMQYCQKDRYIDQWNRHLSFCQMIFDKNDKKIKDERIVFSKNNTKTIEHYTQKHELRPLHHTIQIIKNGL